MAFERKVNEAGLFANTVHPDKSDFNGQILVECSCGRITDYWLNAWRKVTKTGGKYVKLILRPKQIGEHGETGKAPAADEDGSW